MDFDKPKVYGDTFISDGLVIVLVELLAEIVVIVFLGRVVFFLVADMALSTWGIAIVNRPKKG